MYKSRHVAAARWIYERSAKLVAASLAGLTGVLLSHDSSIRRIRLIAEGSLFWSEDRHGTNYRDIVFATLHELLSESGNVGVTVDIDRMENANLIGSAIAALSK
jgi:hexokinase